MRQGFTLVETMIYIAIVGAVMASFIGFSISVSDSRNKNYVVQEVQANGRFALNMMSREIREAQDVVRPAGGSSTAELELEMSGSEPNAEFSVASGTLEFTQGGNPTRAVTSNNTEVTNLRFTNHTPSGEKDNIRIKMDLKYRKGGSDRYWEYSQDYQTSVSLRPH